MQNTSYFPSHRGNLVLQSMATGRPSLCISIRFFNNDTSFVPHTVEDDIVSVLHGV
jgi:hypothetical protein